MIVFFARVFCKRAYLYLTFVVVAEFFIFKKILQQRRFLVWDIFSAPLVCVIIVISLRSYLTSYFAKLHVKSVALASSDFNCWWHLWLFYLCIYLPNQIFLSCIKQRFISIPFNCKLWFLLPTKGGWQNQCSTSNVSPFPFHNLAGKLFSLSVQGRNQPCHSA